MRYAAVGDISHELITFQGKVLTHGNEREMGFLLPMGVRIVQCPEYVKPEETMRLRDHPGLAAVRWPLHREEFRN